MYRLTIILMFTTVFSYAQIDYQGLIRNLEEVTVETDVKEYFKDLPLQEEYDNLFFNDERFLRFHTVIVDKVNFSRGWSGRTTMRLTFFNEQKDYESIKKILFEKYGEPEIDERDHSIIYNWEMENKRIFLEINVEEQQFKSFEHLDITFEEIQ